MLNVRRASRSLTRSLPSTRTAAIRAPSSARPRRRPRGRGARSVDAGGGQLRADRGQAGLRGLVALRDQLVEARVVGRRVVAEVRAHEHVGLGGEVPVAAAREEVAHLRRDARAPTRSPRARAAGCRCRSPPAPRRRTSFATSIGRLFTIRPSTSFRPSHVDRREDERDRHAGAHRAGEVALREDHRRRRSPRSPATARNGIGQAVEVARDRVARRARGSRSGSG